jgi:hypothetical protein
LAAVATIDSSVGDTALEKLAADCATHLPGMAQVQIEYRPSGSFGLISSMNGLLRSRCVT